MGEIPVHPRMRKRRRSATSLLAASCCSGALLLAGGPDPAGANFLDNKIAATCRPPSGSSISFTPINTATLCFTARQTLPYQINVQWGDGSRGTNSHFDAQQGDEICIPGREQPKTLIGTRETEANVFINGVEVYRARFSVGWDKCAIAEEHNSIPLWVPNWGGKSNDSISEVWGETNKDGISEDSFGDPVAVVASVAPSNAPTRARWWTVPPSARPALGPIASPTSTPTGYPSASPTPGPTASPTSTRSGSPSGSPTTLPTAVVSAHTSATPTLAQSSSPSEMASAPPSVEDLLTRTTGCKDLSLSIGCTAAHPDGSGKVIKCTALSGIAVGGSGGKVAVTYTLTASNKCPFVRRIIRQERTDCDQCITSGLVCDWSVPFPPLDGMPYFELAPYEGRTVQMKRFIPVETVNGQRACMHSQDVVLRVVGTYESTGSFALDASHSFFGPAK